jgi:hypothetical protein
MGLGRTTSVLILLCGFAHAQGILQGVMNVQSGVQAITLDNGGSPCSGSGSTNYISCSSAMTLSAGSTIACGSYGQSGGNNETGAVMDSVNGFYENVYGAAHPNSTLSWLVIAVKQNSASGSITPQIYYSAVPNAQANLLCYAFKGTAASNVLDAGGAEQTTSATVTNPTSGTSTAPLSNNEAVAAWMSRNSATAPSSGGGSWLPSGTLTLVGSSQVRQAAEYQIQTTATAVNGPFTGNSTSIATIDSQIALLPLGTTGGTRSMTGMFVPFGAPGSAPTGTMSTTLLGAAGSTLANIHFNAASPYWTLNGTAPTYDSTVNATGTRNIMVNQVAHTFGDAGVSMLVAGGTATGFFSVQDDWSSTGAPFWAGFFFRMASSGATNSVACDNFSIAGGGIDGQIIGQMDVAATGTTYTMKMETVENAGSPASASPTMNMDQDYFIQEHIAGANERYHQLLIYSCGTANCHTSPTWSLLGTINLDHTCTNGANATCTLPTPVVSPTGTVSSGATSMTLSSGTSTVNGQLLLDPTGNCLPWPTLIEAGGGTTSITLSQPTTCGVSGTTVNFYTVPANLKVATNCTVSSGSTSMSCVAPGVGTITAGYAVGATGIIQGTVVSAASGSGPITVTLSSPANTALTNAGVAFWNLTATGVFEFGKNAGGSCGVTSSQWWGSPYWDRFGTWGAFAPN